MPTLPFWGIKKILWQHLPVAPFFLFHRKTLKKGFFTFVPLPHRLEFVGKYKGIRFYNDSLATIPEATIHAIQSLGDKTETLIAGGFDRGVSYEKLVEFLVHSSIKTIILMGQTGKKLAIMLRSNKESHMNIIEASSMEAAIRAAYKNTKEGKICVLSPPQRVFDQYKDYKDRGEQFATWVRRVAAE